jgi:ABC-type antimicrobial peptide transport system permease subunit
MGIALVRGRDFAISDRAGSPQVAIAGETLARRLFPGGDAIGRRIRVDNNAGIELVGIVRDIKYESLGEAAQPLLYRPYAQEADRPGTVLHLRTSRPPDALQSAIRNELAQMEKDVPVTVRPLSAYVNLSIAPLRVGAAALATMGALGLLLALVGVYGLMSHDVARRTSEFGVRLALGASPRRLLRDVLRSGALVVGSGAALGIVLTVAATRVLGSVVAGVRMDRPLVLLLAAGLAATCLPARRATRVDPVTALRCE